jgi:hypothetical protein
MLSSPISGTHACVTYGAISQGFAQPRELLALGGRQTGLAAGAIGARAQDPQAERRRRQTQVAGDGTDRLAFGEHQTDRLGFELLIDVERGGWSR